MSEIKIQKIDESEIDTVLADDIDFEGTLNFKKNLMIKGRFKGDIKAEGALYVDEKANVEARLEANIVTLKGKVKGNVFAHTRVELYSCSSVDGDITAPDVVMESGCRFNGICTMKSPSEVSNYES